jgi:hypothetical protein
MTAKKTRESTKGVRTPKTGAEPKAKKQPETAVEPEVKKQPETVAVLEVKMQPSTAVEPAVDTRPTVGGFEGCYVGPFAEGSGVKVGSGVLPRLFPRNQWVKLSGETEAQALVELGNFKVRQT